MKNYYGEPMKNFGTVKLKVEQLRQAAGMSKNELGYKAEVQRSQLNRFCRNEVTRLDTDVLARFCYALNCEVGDLLEYIPPKESKE